MYKAGKREKVRLLKVPPWSIGAPCPMLLAREHRLFLAYYVEKANPDWDGTSVEVVSHRTPRRQVALLSFEYPHAHYFGPPHEDAFVGHPLASRGFRPHNAFTVSHSSWIARLERMNLADPQADPGRLIGYKHFIFAFHDSTFECIARSFTVSVRTGSVAGVLKQAHKQL